MAGPVVGIVGVQTLDASPATAHTAARPVSGLIGNQMVSFGGIPGAGRQESA